jgi:hypothetical protein
MAEIEEQKLAFEEERARVEAEKQMNNIKHKGARFMFMNTSGMDDKAREYGDLARGEILASNTPWGALVEAIGVALGKCSMFSFRMNFVFG